MASPTIVSGEGTTFVFDGETVGGVTEYRFFEGQARETMHAPINGERRYLPGPPDYGIISLVMYRRYGDSGQAKMQESLANRKIVSCSVTLKNGQSFSFDGFCRILPLVSGRDGVNTCTASVRVAGSVSQ